jgi:hypothetical protein
MRFSCLSKMQRSPEEDSLLVKLLPYGRDQALELSTEVVKLLSKDGAFKEEFSLDEEPIAARKTGVESWLVAVTATQSAQVPWMKVSLELSGCLLKKVSTEVRFASKKGFQTQLAVDPTPGWVLEQALITRKETERTCEALRAAKELQFNQEGDLLRLAECLDVATSSLCRARNSLLFPSPLGFPRALRPFNGFAPPLGPEYLLDFSLFRDRLVVAAFRVAQQPAASQAYYQGIVPDRWFDDPTPPGRPRLVDTTIVFEGGTAIKVLEQHTVSFQVALLTKIQVFLGDAHRVLRDLSMNVVACLAVRPDFYLSSVRTTIRTEAADDDEHMILPLVQPTRINHLHAV